MRFGVRLLQKMCSRLFVQPTLRYATHHVRPPALADRTGVAASVAAAVVAAAASAASVPTITEGDEFARWAADLRRRPPLAGNEVDLVVQGPHEVGRLALAAHRVREATIGGRQFIWEVAHLFGHTPSPSLLWACHHAPPIVLPSRRPADLPRWRSPHQAGGGVEMARARAEHRGPIAYHHLHHHHHFHHHRRLHLRRHHYSRAAGPEPPQRSGRGGE